MDIHVGILWFSVGSETGLYPVIVTGVDEWCTNNQCAPWGTHAMLSLSNSSSRVFCADVRALKKKKGMTAWMDTKEGSLSDDVWIIF